MDSAVTNIGSANDQTVINQKSPKKYGLLISIIVLLFLLVLTVPVIIGAARFYDGTNSAKTHFEAAELAITDFDFELAGEELDTVLLDIQKAQSGLRYMFVLRIMPWVGSQVKASDKLLEAGVESVKAAQSVVTIASDVKVALQEAQSLLAELEVPDGEFSLETISDEARLSLVNTLKNSADELINVHTRLVLAQMQIESFNEIYNVHPKIKEFAEVFQNTLPGMIDSVELLIPVAQTIDQLAGIGEAKQWLVLFLNNTEIRPGGGFIGVYGLMQVEDGEIQDIYSTDSYSIDKLVEDTEYSVLAPSPITDYMGVDNWYFRDANWSPDFAESSKDSIQLLRQEFSYAGLPVPDISGVIGITPTIAENILGITGPITVRGITFNQDNLTETLEYYVEYGYQDVGSTWEDRKDIVGELATAVLNKLLQLPFNDWGEVFTAVNTAIEQKQIMIYSANEDAQLVFDEQGWSGAVDISNTDDVLWVVDANLGALKTDHAIERSIEYHINEAGGDLYATVYATYKHNGDFDWRTTRYQNYVRVYAPLGSKLTAASLSDESIDIASFDQADELGMTSFGTYFKVEPGEQEVLSLVYKLPDSVNTAVDSKLYQLTVLKQLGADNYPLTIDLDFGKKLRVAEPEEDSSNYGDSAYQYNSFLDKDSVFTVQF